MHRLEIKVKLKKVKFLSKNGIQKEKQYISFRFWNEEKGERDEESTGLYWIEPETSVSDIDHNRRVKQELIEKQAKLQQRLDFQSPYTGAREKLDQDFLFLYDEYIEHLITFGKAKGTIGLSRQSRALFGEFRPKGKLGTITPETIGKYYRWLTEVRKLSRNTISRHSTDLANCLNWLERNDHLPKSPFKKMARGERIYQDDDPESNPEVRPKSFFDQNELKQIWMHRYARTKQEELDSTLAWLFSNVVGLRYSDCATLLPKHFFEVEKGGRHYMYLAKRQIKTGKMVYVPLNSTAIRIMEEVAKRNPNLDAGWFRIKKSRDMKSVTGTDKHIAFQNGRHSFANNLKRAGVEGNDITRLSGRMPTGITEKNYLVISDN